MGWLAKFFGGGVSGVASAVTNVAEVFRNYPEEFDYSDAFIVAK